VKLEIELTDEQGRQIAAWVAELSNGRSEPHGGFLDVPGAAVYLSCPVSRVYSLVSAGRLPVHRDGRRLQPI
jgi:excisionase family DNA binding protein